MSSGNLLPVLVDLQLVCSVVLVVDRGKIYWSGVEEGLQFIDGSHSTGLGKESVEVVEEGGGEGCGLDIVVVEEIEQAHPECPDIVLDLNGVWSVLSKQPVDGYCKDRRQGDIVSRLSPDIIPKKRLLVALQPTSTNAIISILRSQLLEMTLVLRVEEARVVGLYGLESPPDLDRYDHDGHSPVSPASWSAEEYVRGKVF